QPREVVRPPLLVPPVLEPQGARDPEVARVEADDLMAGVEDAAVAGPRSPQRERFDVAERRDAIAGGAHSSNLDRAVALPVLDGDPAQVGEFVQRGGAAEA